MRVRVSLLLGTTLLLTAASAVASPPRDRIAPTKPTVDRSNSTDVHPVFHFGARDNRTPPLRIRFRCAIDSSILHSCARAYHALNALTFGRHELRVVAIDRAGNISRLTKSRFTIVGVWDAALDFPGAAPSENPAHDKYGNTVWSYLHSDAKVHDPSHYQPLPQFRVINSGWQEWDLGINPDGTTVLPEVGWSNREIILHPDFERFAILGWRSPYTGNIGITFKLRFPDPTAQAASNGVVWSIDHDSISIGSGVLTPGNDASAEIQVPITVGETIYLVIDDNGDLTSDTTVAAFRLRTISP